MAQASAFADLADLSQPLRAARLVVLSDLDRGRLAELARLLAQVSAARRQEIARRLLDLSEDDATLNFDAVFTHLLGDPDPELRRLALDGLWESDDRTLLDNFLMLLGADPDAGVRTAAAALLGNWVLRGEFDALRPRDNERVLDALRAVAGDTAQPAELRGRAVESLGACSQGWVHDLIERTYRDPAPALQIAALHAMGRNGDAAWLPVLYRELASDDPLRRFEAAEALGEIGEEESAPHLTPLIDDPDQEVQEQAIRALGEIGGRSALEALNRRTQDADRRIAEAVQAAIAAARAEEGLIGGAAQRLLRRDAAVQPDELEEWDESDDDEPDDD
ncbi:MAG TPA: HEAT repeat domain-containing protein [Dehalococcoidia bacterium]|nr:HEAT repeat domain-containing protein [Dehalococcoidia bacterium]